jgi:hypothetical protein
MATRAEITIAAGPSPYANADETLKACLARHGYGIAPNGKSYGISGVLIKRDGHVVLRSRSVWQTTAWLIRRNRKLAALRGAK